MPMPTLLPEAGPELFEGVIFPKVLYFRPAYTDVVPIAASLPFRCLAPRSDLEYTNCSSFGQLPHVIHLYKLR
jgi:hypothetical protein